VVKQDHGDPTSGSWPLYVSALAFLWNKSCLTSEQLGDKLGHSERVLRVSGSSGRSHGSDGGNQMKHRAVIFDLFGTIVDDWSDLDYQEMVGGLADTLGLDRGVFSSVWIDNESARSRMLGLIRFEDDLRTACGRLGMPLNAAAVEGARDSCLKFTQRRLIPRPDLQLVLHALKTRGCRIGMVSNCSWEVPEVWPTLPYAPSFDVAMFSCAEGMMKPDRRIYEAAMERLGTPRDTCLYVGDGASGELTGAHAAGLDVLLICVPHEREIVMNREDARSWRGPVIHSLSQVIDHLR
jgi:putative hydrolase of the HAD superfamily